MRTVCKNLGYAALTLICVGASPVFANDCREDLITAREGMIPIRTPMQAETVSSQEALGVLSQDGAVSGGLSFQRTIDDFWRFKTRRDVDPRDLIVRYHIHEGDDRNGNAAHRDANSIQFPVRIIPSRPRILCEDNDHRIVSGGFTMLARASGIGLAGIYSLEIDVDVEER